MKPKRKIWDHPWKYRESFFIVLELIFLGLIFEVITGGRGAPLLKWPINLIIGIGILATLFFLHFQFRKKHFVRWLSSVPAAISAIVFFAFVTLLLGLIPQDNPDAGRYMQALGLTHMKNSWMMMFSGMYFLITLGMVALRRSSPLNRKNLGFLLNHTGLWITIAAGYLGSGDLMRLHLQVMEGHEPTYLASNSQTRQMYELPFSVELMDFNIEQYNPKFGVFDRRTGQFLEDDGQLVHLIEEGMRTSILGWEIEIEKFEPNSYFNGLDYVPTDSVGAAPAALIRALNSDLQEIQIGWVSCGSFAVIPQHLQLDRIHFLGMTTPEPRKYSSDIILHGWDGEQLPITLEVNKPFKYQGWKLYQISYDERMGKWSQLSVIEAVRDPWLPLVYAGIFLLLAGAVYLFWIGREIKE